MGSMKFFRKKPAHSGGVGGLGDCFKEDEILFYGLLGKVTRDAFVGGGHGVLAFLPVHGADFAVFFEVLKGIDDAEALFDGAAERHVVDYLVADDAIEVDEEEATVGDHFTFNREVTLFVIGVFSCEHIVVV